MQGKTITMKKKRPTDPLKCGKVVVKSKLDS
jgi:hypothetical protein